MSATQPLQQDEKGRAKTARANTEQRVRVQTDAAMRTLKTPTHPGDKRSHSDDELSDDDDESVAPAPRPAAATKGRGGGAKGGKRS